MTRSFFFSTILCAVVLTASAAAQTGGGVRVVDPDGAPAPYVTVIFTCLSGSCADSSVGRITDRFGTAANPFRARAAVALSHIGYTSKFDTIDAGAVVSITLARAAIVTPTIVVTGQYSPTEADRSLYAVRVIDRRQLKSSAAQNLNELMRGELNVRLSQDNVLGSSMSIQGLSGNNVKILIDGLAVAGRVGDDVDISQINLHDAERVEVVEGPLSVAYGTNALGGVVNVITRKNADDGIAGEFNAHGESVGVYNADGRLALGFPSTRIILSGGRHFFGGFSRPDTSRFKRWKPREQYFGSVDVIREMLGGTLNYTGRFGHDFILNRGVPRAPYGETAFDDNYRTSRLSNRLQFLRPFDLGSLDLSAAYTIYTRRKNTYGKNLVTLEQTATGPDDQDTTGFDSWSIRGSFGGASDSVAISWQSGFDIAIDNTTGGRIAAGEQEVGDYAIFAGVRYTPAPWLSLQPGLRIAYNTRYTAPLIPSLNARADPGDGVSFRGSYARGFRAPSLRDLFFYFVDINHHIIGNPDLRAETSQNLNFSLNWKTAVSDNAVVELGAAGYYNDITDLITLVGIDGDVYSYRNIGAYTATGFNLTARYDRADLTGSIGLGWTGRENGLKERSGVDRFAFAAEATAGLLWKIADLGEIWIDYKYTGRLPSYSLDADGGISERFVSAYHTLDLSVARAILNDLLTVRVGAKNLFDVVDVATTVQGGSVHGSTSSSIPVSWGRSFFINLSVTAK